MCQHCLSLQVDSLCSYLWLHGLSLGDTFLRSSFLQNYVERYWKGVWKNNTALTEYIPQVQVTKVSRTWASQVTLNYIHWFLKTKLWFWRIWPRNPIINWEHLKYFFIANMKMTIHLKELDLWVETNFSKLWFKLYI